jgi:hypothetical protein
MALLNQPSGKEIEDREFVWQDGCMWISRTVPDAGLQMYSHHAVTASNSRLTTEMLELDSQGPVLADFKTPGIMSSLYFRPYTELWRPLLQGWMDAKVDAVGLNWKDLGLASGHFDANNLSYEYTSVVTRVASNTGFSVGDRVYGMGRGRFGNYTGVPVAFAHKLQPSDDPVEIATMPLVYMTAVYAFEHVTKLTTGQTVLIQSY